MRMTGQVRGAIAPKPEGQAGSQGVFVSDHRRDRASSVDVPKAS